MCRVSVEVEKGSFLGYTVRDERAVYFGSTGDYLALRCLIIHTKLH
jgi:hypothetical protein